MNVPTSSIAGVLCSGSIVHDTLVRPVDGAHWGTTTFVESMDPHVGGNGANTSIALARIGIPVRLLGAIGNDDRASFLLDTLRDSGVDTSAISTTDCPTAATIVIVNTQGDRQFLHRLGASEQAFGTPIDFSPSLTAGMAHYHLASLFLLPRLRSVAAETLRRARNAGLTTSLDTNWDPHGRWMLDIEPCLPHLDFLFLNEDEARMVTGSSDPKLAANVILAKGVRTAVMKLGSRGCAIYTPHQHIVCPAFDVHAKDTTGAGDSFVAGFLAALRRNGTLAEAGHFANAVGALSVQHIGAVAGVPSYPGIQAWIRSARLRSVQGGANGVNTQ
jgi:sugar/nucleoside kinase (ribokinase family)